MTNKVKAYVTTLGVTVIGEVTSEDKESVGLNSALFLSAQEHPQSKAIMPQFSPVAVFAAGEPLKGTDVVLQKQNIVFEHAVHENIVTIYSSIVGKVAVIGAGAIKDLDNLIKLR